MSAWGQSRTRGEPSSTMVFWSAAPSTTDEPCCVAEDDRYGPERDLSTCSRARAYGSGLFDHLVGANEDRWRDGEAELSRRLKIDGELPRVRALLGQHRRYGPLENACDVFAGAALCVGKIVTKTENATIARHLLPLADCRQPLRRGGCGHLRRILRQRLVSTDDHARRTVRAHGSECGSVLRTMLPTVPRSRAARRLAGVTESRSPTTLS